MGHGVEGHTHFGEVTPEVAVRVADVMQALSAPSRVRILAQLRTRPHSVSEIVAAVGMEQSAVSHQLRLLRDMELVIGERSGRRVVYSLYDDHVAALLDQAVGHIEHIALGVAGRGRGRSRGRVAPHASRLTPATREAYPAIAPGSDCAGRISLGMRG
jgi:DNA-binding transcriptional ArsR family regulator